MYKYMAGNITVYNTSALDISENAKKSEISETISRWIVENCERDIIYNSIEQNYEGFSKSDTEFIASSAASRLERGKERRIQTISEEIFEYLSSAESINIMGFIRFRLKEYRKEIEEIIDMTVEKYICEREYYEFIELLREYIRLRPFGFDILNVISNGKRNFYLDKNGNDLTKAFQKEYAFDMDLTEDDKLLTALVLSVPQKIIWHGWDKIKSEEIKKTLVEIFGGKIYLCKGCKLCRKYNKYGNILKKY